MKQEINRRQVPPASWGQPEIEENDPINSIESGINDVCDVDLARAVQGRKTV